VGAPVQGLAGQLGGGEGGQGDHPDRRGAPAQLGDQVGALDPGHAEVEDDHVGLPVDGQGEGLAAVGGLPDQLEAPSLEGRPEQRSQLRDVVGDEGADRCGWMHGGDMLTLRDARTNRPDEYSCLSPGRGTPGATGPT
jgi:hypothetical protein